MTRLIEPLERPPDVSLRLPGSKSITNRALPCAALAGGSSVLDGVGFGDDTEAMLDSLGRLGASIEVDRSAATARVEGTAGRIPIEEADLNARQSGTTARFLTAIAALAGATVHIDADPQMRGRPMAPLLAALRHLGARITCEGGEDALPLRVEGGGAPSGPAEITEVKLPGGISSQFASGLLLAAPLRPGGLRILCEQPIVSRPYLEMTVAVMEAFGVETRVGRHASFEVRGGQSYKACEYRIEPDASSASYFLAAAALTGGRVRVEGLGRDSIQGDVAFADLLARMGATVERASDHIEVRGPAELRGIDADLSDLSDTAPTLAAVAVFANTPTRVRGIGFIRAKESDRVGNVVRELRRVGIDAVEEADGFLINPGRPQPAEMETYGDHRLAMAFALLGLRSRGIVVRDPGCVAKTFPEFWEAFELLGARASGAGP